VTLSIESKTYDDFKKYCEERAIMLSKKLELVMKEIMKEKKGMWALLLFFVWILLPLVSAVTVSSDGFRMQWV